jgi:preprotein translocase subunit SecE
MAKTASQKSATATGKAQKAGAPVAVQKAQAKGAGRFKGALSRSSARAAASHSSSAPRGAVSTKPRGRVRTFFREVRIEMKKVTWPPRKELLKSTGVVIIAVAIAGAFIGLFDLLWTYLVDVAGLGG